MTGRSPHPLLRFIRRITPVTGAAEAPDAELLARFVARNDETAFATLVQRHGPMVLGVCARVLGNSADAEDAFQATFLVLVRRAGSVGRPELLGNWLYGVAHRTALKARAQAVLRGRHEAEVACRSVASPTEDVLWHELQPILDEELCRLPLKYRAPLVLCHLEGHTHEEAALRLGCPRETVTTRLIRGRERLRRQLVRRGVTLSTGTLATLLVEQALAAGVSGVLLETTIKTVTGTAPLAVVALTEGVLQAMWLTKVHIVLSIVLGVACLAGGAGLVLQGARAQAPKHTAPPAAAAPAAQPAGAEQPQREVLVKTSPPVVVRTVPEAGDTQVDAKTTTEIRVTFSKEMADQSWSWSQISQETFPKMTGKPRYDKDRRTCILPVELKPGTTYVIWLNPEKFKGFRDADSRPAVFYPLVFETKP